MTINREAAELMALRLTSAVDVVDTFKEALRLAAVALQETREVPEVEPGTAGTATTPNGAGERVMRTSPRGIEGRGLLFTVWVDHEGNRLTKGEVEDFVPDAPDTAALRAEVERLETAVTAKARTLDEVYGRLDRMQERAERADAAWERKNAEFEASNARADAAEARLARLTPEAATEAVLAFVKRTGRPEWINEAGARRLTGVVLALVADDEQAANISPSQHDPNGCGDPSCDC